MAEKKIGTKLALDGEAEFKKTIASINTNLTVLGSELGKVSAQFDNNADSMEALKSKQAVYNKQIDEHKSKVEKLKEALSASNKEFGEGSKQSQNWKIALNRAEGSLAKTENALKDTTDKINNFGKEADQTGDQVEKAGEQAKKSGDDAKKGENGWSKLGEGLGKAGALAGKAIAGLGVAAVGTATAVAGMTIKAAKSADDINTMAKQTGLSTEEIQKFMYASEQIDVPIDTLTGSMAKLTKNMASAKDGSKKTSGAFAELGVKITDNNGNLRDNEDVFNESINALAKMTNETERDALAMEIFGKSAQDLNPLILGGADALKTLGDQAQAAGVILGQDSLDNLNSFADAMDTFKATLSGSGSLFATAFAGPMAEGLNTVTGYLTDLTGAFNEGGFSAVSDELGIIITDIITKINESLPKILEFGLNIITKIIEGISANLPALMDGAMNIIMMLVNSFISMLPEILKMGLEIIKELALGIADALPELIPTLVDTVLMIVETLIDNIDMLVDAAVAIIMALSDGLIAALPRLIEKAPVIITKLVAALTNNIPKLLEAGAKLIMGLGAGLINAIPQLLLQIPKIIDSIVTSFSGYYSKIFDIGKNIVKGVWEGILSMATWLSSQVTGFFDGIVGDIKDSLGIHSPSKVFAGIGGNMALGLGEGFATEMDGVAKRINNSVPTSLNVNGASSGSQRNIIVQSPPIYLDGKTITSRTSFHQSNRNQTYSRAMGRPVTT